MHEELASLAIVIRKTFCAETALGTLLVVGERREAALRRFPWTFAEGVRLVICTTDRVAQSHIAVLLKVRERSFGRVDGYVSEIGAAQALQLSVEIREIAPLKERIV